MNLEEATCKALQEKKLNEAEGSSNKYGFTEASVNDKDCLFGGEGEAEALWRLEGIERYYKDYAEYVENYEPSAGEQWPLGSEDADDLRAIADKIREAITLYEDWVEQYL